MTTMYRVPFTNQQGPVGYKRFSYRRGTAQRYKSVEMLAAAAQLYEKSHLKRLNCNRSFKVIGNAVLDRPYNTSY